MSTKAKDMMTELIETDEKLAVVAVDAQVEKEREIYRKVQDEKEKSAATEAASVAKTFDDQFLSFFDGGR